MSIDIYNHFVVFQQIFERAVNYLRLLAAKSLFPRGNLTEQVIVRINDNKLQGVQLIPRYLSKEAQPLAQLVQLKEMLYASEALPASQKSMDFFFPAQGQNLAGTTALEDLAKIVQNVNEINLLSDSGKIFICDGHILSNQTIFEAKAKSLQGEEKSDELWVMLSRFCSQHEAIGSLHLLPSYLDKYVKYDNPLALPDVFMNGCNSAKPLEVLRIILGMYPTQIEMFDLEVFSQDMQKLLKDEKMPAWYKSKAIQMGYIANKFEFVQGAATVADGVNMKCQPTVEGLIDLCSKYE